MGPHRRCFDARSLDGTPDQLRDRAAGPKRAERCIDTQEDMLVIDPRSEVIELVPNGVANLLRKG